MALPNSKLASYFGLIDAARSQRANNADVAFGKPRVAGHLPEGHVWSASPVTVPSVRKRRMWDVTPRLAAHQQPHRHSRQSELSGQRSYAGTVRDRVANHHDISFGDFGVVVTTAVTYWNRCVSLFLEHVGVVVLLRSQKQVCRIAARRIVAAMQHMQSPCDRAMRNRPCHAMRARWFAGDIKRAVSIAIFSGCPRPAIRRISRSDVTPKAINISACHVGIIPCL